MAFYLHSFYELFIFSNIGELYRNQPLTSMSFRKMPTETCRKTIYALLRGTGVISFTSFPNVTPLNVVHSTCGLNQDTRSRNKWSKGET